MARPRSKLQWFPHYVASHNHIKIRSLRKRFGNDGYAVFFITLEKMCDSECLTVSIHSQDLILLADEMDIMPDRLIEIYQHMKLLGMIEMNNDTIYSPSLADEIKPFLDRKERDRERKNTNRSASSNNDNNYSFPVDNNSFPVDNNSFPVDNTVFSNGKVHTITITITLLKEKINKKEEISKSEIEKLKMWAGDIATPADLQNECYDLLDEIEKIKSPPISAPPPSFQVLSYNQDQLPDLMNELMHSDDFHTKLAMRIARTFSILVEPDWVKSKIPDFINDVNDNDNFPITLRNAKTYFKNWITKKVEISQKTKSNEPTTNHNRNRKSGGVSASYREQLARDLQAGINEATAK